MLTTKEILTREEVMEILKIGRSTFYKLLQTGQLKGFRRYQDRILFTGIW